MPKSGRLCGALAVPLVLCAAAAQGQDSRWALAAPSPSGARDLRLPRGDLRAFEPPPPDGLVARLPVADNLRIGVGRIAVLEVAGFRTNLEPERRPTDMRRRERNITAVGLSFRF